MDPKNFNHCFFHLPTANRLKWFHKNRSGKHGWTWNRITEAQEVFSWFYINQCKLLC